MNATDYRNIAVAQLSDEDFSEYEALSAQAEEKAANFSGKFMTATGAIITDQEEYLNYLLSKILDDLGVQAPVAEEFQILTIEESVLDGAEYEIEVYNADEIDLAHTIVNALYHGGVRGDNRDEIGMYQREGKLHSVFIEPSDVAKAVEIINNLGFQTDEN